MEKPAVTFAATVLLVLPLFNRKVTINYNAIKKNIFTQNKSVRLHSTKSGSLKKYKTQVILLFDTFQH